MQAFPRDFVFLGTRLSFCSNLYTNIIKSLNCVYLFVGGNLNLQLQNRFKKIFHLQEAKPKWREGASISIKICTRKQKRCVTFALTILVRTQG